MRGVSIRTLGCKVNQVESDQIAVELASRIRDFADEPRAVVINTCAVTGEAESKTRKTIRRAAAEPGVLVVVVTGCAATVSGAALAALDPKVLVVTDKSRVADSVAEFLAKRDVMSAEPEVALVQGRSLPSPRRTRRAIKVQDGCENFCTYCIVPYARGAGCSTPHHEIVDTVRLLAGEGVGEVVLTGINIGKYWDRESGANLTNLVEALQGTGIHRLRLSSIEPPDVTDELLTALARDRFGCEHLHIPLQSGSDRTLLAMGRRYTVCEYEAVVERVRSVWPDAAITTDVIVGFPGESNEDFERTVQTCIRIGFSKIHVFRYSPREGTPAAALQYLCPSVIADRAARLRNVADELAETFLGSRRGRELEVVVERTAGGAAHFTSREYLQFAVPVDQVSSIAGDFAQGAVVRVAYDALSGSTVGLE